MVAQTGANEGRVYVWKIPMEEYHKDVTGATVIPDFVKVKVWSTMRYGKLSELIILPELFINREGKKNKFDTKKYQDLVMEGEMYNFWTEAYEECG